MLFALVLREMQARVGGQWVGAVWTLIEPLAHVMIMRHDVRVRTQRGACRASEYPVFLVTGLLPYLPVLGIWPRA